MGFGFGRGDPRTERLGPLARGAGQGRAQRGDGRDGIPATACAAARRPVRGRPALSARHRAARRAWCGPTGRWRSACTAHRANSARRGSWPWRSRSCRWRGHAGSAICRPGAAPIDEFEIEARIVDDERPRRRGIRGILHHLGEFRLVGEEFVGQAVDARGLRRHLPLGIEDRREKCGRSADDRTARRSRSRRSGGLPPARSPSFPYQHHLAHQPDCPCLRRSRSVATMLFTCANACARPWSVTPRNALLHAFLHPASGANADRRISPPSCPAASQPRARAGYGKPR